MTEKDFWIRIGIGGALLWASLIALVGDQSGLAVLLLCAGLFNIGWTVIAAVLQVRNARIYAAWRR